MCDYCHRNKGLDHTAVWHFSSRWHPLNCLCLQCLAYFSARLIIIVPLNNMIFFEWLPHRWTEKLIVVRRQKMSATVSEHKKVCFTHSPCQFQWPPQPGSGNSLPSSSGRRLYCLQPWLWGSDDCPAGSAGKRLQHQHWYMWNSTTQAIKSHYMSSSFTSYFALAIADELILN